MAYNIEGRCSCGRNHYIIVIPSTGSSAAQVSFDDRYENHDAQNGPFPAYLRVPLPWLQSTTYSFYPNESHSDIRRVFTPWHAPHTKRHFCGFCGTPLTHWSEESREEAEMVSVNLGSLRSDSLSTLAEAGILPSAQNTEEHAGPGGADKTVDRRAVGHEIHGEPWFEEILEGSALGRMRRRRGGKTSADGRARVEWEIVDFEGDEHGESTEGLGTGKRKLEDSTVGEDLVMREGH